MRAIVFIDGQNLFHTAKRTFNLSEDYPIYDPKKVGERACQLVGPKLRARNGSSEPVNITLAQTRFYTGIPKPEIDPKPHRFWRRKLAKATKDGVEVVHRTLHYQERIDGSGYDRREKGIDVRIALDILMLGLRRKYDIAILFSRDSDFEEVGLELETLKGDDRFSQIQYVCCFPRVAGQRKSTYGVDGWIWCPFDRDFLENCRERTNFHECSKIHS